MAYKDFQAATVLPAQDVNQYLMNQSVIVFDDASQRTSTLTSLTEGMVTYLKDQDVIEFYNGSSWQPIVFANPRNLFYNGEMLVTQRATSVAGITSTGYHTADRWKTEIVSSGTYTQSVVDDVPATSGFSKALNYLCTSATASPNYVQCSQWLEGFDCQSINMGTATARSLWLSFWVKSNRTGTYNVEIRNETAGTFLSKQYTISASDTWQKVVLEYKPNTANSITANINTGLKIQFWLAASSTFAGGTVNANWGSTNNQRAVGNANLSSAVNNYWRMTGAMLSVGYPAPFEFKSYNDHFHECQRYYQRHPQAAMRGVTFSGIFARMGYGLPAEMRTNASVSSNGGTMGFFNGGAAVVSGVTFTTVYNNSPASVEADISSSGWGSANPAVFYKGAGHGFVLIADAEL